MGNSGVRLQKLRDFTVQIRHPRTDAIVGTGIAVSSDGKIVTCAHVVIAAGVNPREGRPIPGHWQKICESIFGEKPDALKDAKEAELIVYFPEARGGEEKKRRAKVVACFPQHDDDIVLLQLVDGLAPLAPEQIPMLGKAENSLLNGFLSYGFCLFGDRPSGYATGKILGCLPCPEGLSVHAGLVQLESSQITKGMSGSAVLDTEWNLIVGIVSETWFPDATTKHRDTAWAVNARVLSLEPLGLELQDEPYPKRAAPQPKTDIDVARAQVASKLEIGWNNAPTPIPEWVGRVELLKEVSADWVARDKQITGLIGFGGEGKSSLARRWLDDLLVDKSQPKPDGVFWWGFYTKPSVDEFFEAALKYMSGGKIDPRKIPSANMRAQIIGAMLGAGRYLFVLDGLEVMQHQEGDQYGLFKSADLREFLSYLASSGHQSFCLITSRAPVFDLMEYTTYTHRDVTRLSASDGRDLLRNLGVKGKNEALDKVVADWDGHALTLSLLGGYLFERHKGDVTYINEIPPPTADEPRYERVHRVLRRYDEHLTEPERAFLMLFSAFRTPVKELAFDKVFRAKTSTDALNAPIAALNNSDFEAMVKRLVAYRILRFDRGEHHYTAHPLIRAHYLAHLREGKGKEAKDAHERIKDYYLDIAGDMPYQPTLDDLTPLIEVVHHACQAGAYDEAHGIRRDRIDQGERKVLIWELGAYETMLALVLEFFPYSESSQDPQVTDPNNKAWILNTVGLCLMSLGRLGEAGPFYERAIKIALNITEDWHNASRGYQNLAGLYAYLGALASSANAASEALTLARRVEDKENEWVSLATQGWIFHLRGDMKAADTAYKEAETLVRELNPADRYLYGFNGSRYAHHLRRSGKAGYARQVTVANLAICEHGRFLGDLSRCHSVLGDLDADSGQHESARKHYDEALKIARGISHRPALIKGLLARGRWSARLLKDAPAALSDLNEALEYAVQGGYRIYEVDIRIGLALSHLADKDKQTARTEVERAGRMSEEMGYYWGKVDAEEVLAVLDKEG